MKLGGNMKNIMKQMGKMKEQMERLQNEAGEKDRGSFFRGRNGYGYGKGQGGNSRQ